MPGSNSHDNWSRLNEPAFIEALRQDCDPACWEMCGEFVRFFLGRKFSNLPSHMKDEVVQETMLAVHKNLATFRFESKFTTWIVSVARNRTIDSLRRLAGIHFVSTDELPDLIENGLEVAALALSQTPEEIVLTNEKIQSVFAAIEAFLQMHKKSERNRQILRLVLFDGLSQKEAASQLGVPAPVVGVVVRAARTYLRQELLD